MGKSQARKSYDGNAITNGKSMQKRIKSQE